MILEDLKLLIDIAWHERHGQQGFFPGKGFGAAKDRLVKQGLIIRNPSQSRNHSQVTLSTAGERLIRAYLGDT